MALVITAILIQEVLPGGNRTAYIGLTLGAILMFIHYTEFARLATDDYIHRQQVALDTDPLTGVHSRYAYSRMLKEYDISGGLPDSFAAFTIDINGLKRVNDAHVRPRVGGHFNRPISQQIIADHGHNHRCATQQNPLSFIYTSIPP